MERIPARIQECTFLTFISVGLAENTQVTGCRVVFVSSGQKREYLLTIYETRKVLMGLWEFPNIKSWEYTVYIFVCVPLFKKPINALTQCGL